MKIKMVFLVLALNHPLCAIIFFFSIHLLSITLRKFKFNLSIYSLDTSKSFSNLFWHDLYTFLNRFWSLESILIFLLNLIITYPPFILIFLSFEKMTTFYIISTYANLIIAVFIYFIFYWTQVFIRKPYNEIRDLIYNLSLTPRKMQINSDFSTYSIEFEEIKFEDFPGLENVPFHIIKSIRWRRTPIELLITLTTKFWYCRAFVYVMYINYLLMRLKKSIKIRTKNPPSPKNVNKKFPIESLKKLLYIVLFIFIVGIPRTAWNTSIYNTKHYFRHVCISKWVVKIYAGKILKYESTKYELFNHFRKDLAEYYQRILLKATTPLNEIQREAFDFYEFLYKS